MGSPNTITKELPSMLPFSEIVNMGVGTDIESVNRFKDIVIRDNDKFLNKIFTGDELNYCFSKDEPSPHLAARFAGKEAVIKALYSIDIKDVFYKDIEILNSETGVPCASLKDTYDNIHIKISLSHSKEWAIAFVMAMEMNDNE